MKDLAELAQYFKSSEAKGSGYRKSLYSCVLFDEYHKETAKGHVVYIKQYRKDFYKPRAFNQDAEGFFGFNQMMRDMRMEHLVSEVEDEYKPLMNQLRQLFKEGYILHHWNIKTIRALQYVDSDQLEFIKKCTVFPGHIRAIKHSKAQYPEHKPLETSDGKVFYYRTSWSNVFKPDLDLTSTNNSFKFEEDEVIDQGNINVVSNPNEEPLIIEG